jgi:hypothetical protein
MQPDHRRKLADLIRSLEQSLSTCTDRSARVALALLMAADDELEKLEQEARHAPRRPLSH